MNIGINASFLRKSNTGIGQVTINFLRKLIELKVQSEKYKDVHFFLYLEEDIDPSLHLELPQNIHKRIFLPLYKRDDLIRKLWWEKILLPRKVNADRCDVLISLYQSATFIANTHIKHVMLVHDLIPLLFPQYLDNMRKQIYHQEVKKGICGANSIVSVSEHTKKDLITKLGIAQESITVASIGVDPIFVSEVSNQDRERVTKKYDLPERYIYTGGGLEIRKNVESTLLAYSKLITEAKKQKTEIPPLVVSGKHLPGNSLATDVCKLTKDLEIEQYVIFIGFVPQQDLPALYSGAQFFCFPSHYEGFGMPMLEAMSVGTPVLTADNSSLREVGAEAVVYCDDYDLADISAKMKMLVENNALRKQLREKGFERAKKFSWNDIVEAMTNQL